LEYLQELLSKIKKLTNEKSENGMSEEEKQEINAMISELEIALAALQKRLTGSSIIKSKDENTKEISNDIDTESFEGRIEVLETMLVDLRHEKLNKIGLEELILNNINITDEILPSDAVEELKKQYKESFTNEKFEELLIKLDIKNLSKEEKELYKSIIDDRYISDDEISNLSYNQMETLGKFIFIKNGKDRYVEESLINTDLKAGTLLSIPIISNDKNFNKALFSMVETMNDERTIIDFMYPITGTHHTAKLIAFPEIQHKNYNGKDMSKVLGNMIEQYKTLLDGTIKANGVEHYQNKIAQFTDLFNLYQDFLGNEDSKLEKEEYIYNLREYLLDDFISILKTGLTVSEVEQFEKTIAKIDKLIEDSEKKEILDIEIKDMIKKLKEELEEIYRRLGGRGEIEIDKNLETQNSDGLTQTMKEFKSIVSSLKKALEEITTKGIKDDSMSIDDELKLIEKLKI
jgi:hypothetical protein